MIGWTVKPRWQEREMAQERFTQASQLHVCSQGRQCGEQKFLASIRRWVTEQGPSHRFSF